MDRPLPTVPANSRPPGRGRPMSTDPARCARVPVPGSQPPTRTSAARMFRILSHSRVRRPGWYSEAGRLSMIPSRPRSRVAASSAAASPGNAGGTCTLPGTSSPRSSSRARRSTYGLRSRWSRPDRSTSKMISVTGTAASSPPPGRPVRIRRCSAVKSGHGGERGELGIGGGDVAAGTGPDPDPPARHRDAGPQAIPLRLGHELGGVRRQPGRRGGQHGRDEARAVPGRLPRHRVPPRVQAESMPGVTPRRSRGS